MIVRSPSAELPDPPVVDPDEESPGGTETSSVAPVATSSVAEVAPSSVGGEVVSSAGSASAVADPSLADSSPVVAPPAASPESVSSTVASSVLASSVPPSSRGSTVSVSVERVGSPPVSSLASGGGAVLAGSVPEAATTGRSKAVSLSRQSGQSTTLRCSSGDGSSADGTTPYDSTDPPGPVPQK
ncbi:hypothetical protein BRC81_06325 [Halobacteriales archaeon QS_1_68_20]|nr:MAG: hypothetical protein BRC81_06325 [Halobacteriales archaeon QS_1_68_20]